MSEAVEYCFLLVASPNKVNSEKCIGTQKNLFRPIEIILLVRSYGQSEGDRMMETERR